MQRFVPFLFAALGLAAIGIGCSGGGLGTKITPMSGSRISGSTVRSTTVSASTVARRGIRMVYIAYSMKQHKIVQITRGWSSWAKGVALVPAAKQTPTPTPAWTPEPTPSPGYGYPCSYGDEYCFYLNPDGDGFGEALWCTDCGTGYGTTISAQISGISGSAPPGMIVEGNSSTDTTEQNCVTGCTLSTCTQPYPTCWVQALYWAVDGAQPANYANSFGLEYALGYVQNSITVNPDVVDLDDSSGSAPVVSYPGPVTNTFPTPLVVGQQMNVQASPASTLTNVQWAYETTPAADVVGGYGLTPELSIEPPTFVGAIVSPSPAPTAGNPMIAYWLSDLGIGKRHVRMTAQVPGVTGPLFADVYYPVLAPTPVVTAKALPANVYATYPFQVGNCSSGLLTALSAGDWNCSQGYGIAWSFSATYPAGVLGNIAMAQVVTAARTSGTLNGVQSTVVGPGPPPIDGNFPYGNFWTSTGVPGALIEPDSPGARLTGSVCNQMSDSGTYTDYFMFQEESDTYRPTIWVTLGVGTWNWGGTATLKRGTWQASNLVSPVSKYTSSSQLPTWPDLPAQGINAYGNPLPQCYATPTPAPSANP